MCVITVLLGRLAAPRCEGVAARLARARSDRGRVVIARDRSGLGSRPTGSVSAVKKLALLAAAGAAVGYVVRRRRRDDEWSPSYNEPGAAPAPAPESTPSVATGPPPPAAEGTASPPAPVDAASGRDAAAEAPQGPARSLSTPPAADTAGRDEREAESSATDDTNFEAAVESESSERSDVAERLQDDPVAAELERDARAGDES